jgi:anti-sigma factor RsiW
VHPFADLSAYLDGALDHQARVSVESHLVGCPLCRTRLGELRATARLLAALPVPAPARSLVPRVSVPVWLAPIRTLATLASGAALFLFVASAVLAGLPIMAPSVGGAPAAAPAQDRNSASGPVAGGAPAPTSPPAAAFGTSASSTPAPAELRTAADSAKASATPTPAAQAEATSPGAESLAVNAPQRPQLGPSPWFWLVLGVALGAVALFLQRRLRAP